MSLRLEMLQVARLAPKLLDDAAERMKEYYLGEFLEDGGAADRSGKSDLYYTVFALESLLALQVEPPDVARTAAYLEAFGDGADDGEGEELDLVHLACLARCWAALPGRSLEDEVARRIAERIERYRSKDGAFNSEAGADEGTIYGVFVTVGAYQDLGLSLPRPEGVVDCILRQRTGDGAFANGPDLPVGTLPGTAAAVTLLRHLDAAVPPECGPWMLTQVHEQGGFLAIPDAPMPDLLSTATGLHALSGMQVSFEPVKERCLDFLDSLWTGRGFCGNWADDEIDGEYGFYALLALGHLSL